ncbi:MAG TPA: hypothetical protein ENK82_06180 [Campylobacterales bacterium]|nr:hypothetical protein [Campylobacterales bacterium]
MYRVYAVVLMVMALLFTACSEKSAVKKELEKQEEESKAEGNYSVVINKSIKECAEHNITLDRKRITNFMLKAPKATIDKTAQSKEKVSKELCQFFVEETSLEKIKKVEALSAKIIESCQKVGVKLSKEGINKKVETLPFFVIKKGLKLNKESSIEECELMQKKYQ